MWWERRRPPLRLTEQPVLAERADLYRRREAHSEVHHPMPVPWLVFLQLMAFSSWALISFELPLMVVAIGAMIVEAFAYMLAESRRTRQARAAGGTGLHGEGETV